MIDNIDELNIALWSLNELMDSDFCAERNLIIEEYKKNIKEGRMPDYGLTIDYSVQLGLMNEVGAVVKMQDVGLTYIELNKENRFDISDEQKNFLFRACFLNGTKRKETRDCLKCFVESKTKSTFVWSEIDNIPLGDLYWVAEHLLQLGILVRTDSGFEVYSTYTETIAVFLNEPKGWTEEELMKYLVEKKEIGNFAEQMIKTYEENRLKAAGHIVESHTVNFVGKLKVNAGYDIESFDGKSDDMNYDRFIEVKGSKGANLRFVWSSNEVEVAKKLGKKYWIYFQGGVDMKKRKVKNAPLLFQDPYQNIYLDKKLPISAHGYVVEAKISGNSI